MATTTSKQVLKLGTAANSLTDFTDNVGDVDISRSSAPLQSLGSRAWEKNQGGGLRTFSFTVTLGENSATTTFLSDKLGAEVFFEHGPGGSATGNIKLTGSVILTGISMPTPFNDRRLYTLTGVPASDLTIGNY